jgi:6-pyruvoyltetrahydropterin/6-carboxytetrahydropterin synthase
MHTIYKKTSFECAHKLENHPKCGKLHGHSYIAETWIKGNELVNPHGFIIDFQEISNYFKQFDHSDIVLTISCEQLTKDSAEYFTNKINSFTMIRVRIWETATSYAEYEIRN